VAHFAKIENGIVTQVIVVSNDNAPGEFPQSEAPGVAFCKRLFGEDTEWKQTSYNGNFRVRYAGIGFEYSEQYDAFIPPKPTEDAIFNEETLDWEIQIEENEE
jgi:hypothetical protein